jgi:hypothetical protein
MLMSKRRAHHGAGNGVEVGASVCMLSGVSYRARAISNELNGAFNKGPVCLAHPGIYKAGTLDVSGIEFNRRE